MKTLKINNRLWGVEARFYRAFLDAPAEVSVGRPGWIHGHLTTPAQCRKLAAWLEQAAKEMETSHGR